MTIRSEHIEYTAGNTTLKGYVAWDDAQDGPSPGILVVHEWWGHTDFVEDRARALAELGYVGFALDLYGDGLQVDTPEEAGACAGDLVGNPMKLRERFEAALDALKGMAQVDSDRVGAIGFCFGGAVAISMARQGVPLDGVVAFHAGLGNIAPLGSQPIRTQFHLFTGAEDPMAPPEQVDAFVDEMSEAGVPVGVTRYPGVKHAFTNPGATEKGERFGLPLAYDVDAARDSWDGMNAFFGRLWMSA